MKHIVIIVIALLSVLPIHSQKEISTETTTYYFIRHAEKDRSDKTNRNPHLTEIGKDRAEHWSKILKHVKFDAVYSTDYNRTKETAQPTATKNSVDITLYNPRNIDGKTFMNATKGKTVLIVGHSNTTPMFVNAILGKEKYKDINDSNNGNLYTITIIDGKTSDQVLVIN
ncbi:SixA phosphatase family protein [Ichthyenterobacterium magnum]|uniref:Histidine phosphatase superfamily protein (Branch 1) n=1 Tax=Ichthyenterobacterium magnum TaxID=1230530 RepID=A0A420DLR6_9FLAO|nr:phosphoglycerate mutase family protein [Ichthyenterobacterium magnum]RKE95109.1 histidine phosphatase superfamily protein (branch 1) [Ichthyenterobacterium magnum]